MAEREKETIITTDGGGGGGTTILAVVLLLAVLVVLFLVFGRGLISIAFEGAVLALYLALALKAAREQPV